MTISDWLMILVVLIGPILAVQIQKKLEIWKEKKNRKLEIFKTLMATRGTPLNSAHVEALNRIDLEFSIKNAAEKKVVDSWRLYLDHLNSLNVDYGDPNYNSIFDIWAAKKDDYLIDLLYDMSQVVGYEFDKVHLKKGSYTPRGYSDYEMEGNFIRRGIIRLLVGNQTIPINIVNFPESNAKEEKEALKIDENSGAKGKKLPSAKTSHKKRGEG